MSTQVLRRLVLAVVVVALLLTMVLTTKFVGPNSTVPTASASGQGLDPHAWAQANYDSAVVPAIQQHAQPWETLIAAITADPNAAGEKYGQCPDGNCGGGGNSYSYSTTVTGTVATGTFDQLALNAPGTPAGVTIGFPVGPAITGSAIRDASGLLKFGMFTNQGDYQQVGTELNTMVKTEVLANFDATTTVGKTVTIVGAFTWDGSKNVYLVPVSIQVAS